MQLINNSKIINYVIILTVGYIILKLCVHGVGMQIANSVKISDKNLMFFKLIRVSL